VAQAGFGLGGWEALSPVAAAALTRMLLGATPYAAVTIAVTAIRRAEEGVVAALRVAAASPPALEHAVQVLDRVAGGWDVALERLDGHQDRGLAATLPIGVADIRH